MLREQDIELAVLFYGGAEETITEYALNSIAIRDLLPPTLESLVLGCSARRFYPEDRFGSFLFRGCWLKKPRFALPTGIDFAS